MRFDQIIASHSLGWSPTSATLRVVATSCARYFVDSSSISDANLIVIGATGLHPSIEVSKSAIYRPIN